MLTYEEKATLLNSWLSRNAFWNTDVVEIEATEEGLEVVPSPQAEGLDDRPLLRIPKGNILSIKNASINNLLEDWAESELLAKLDKMMDQEEEGNVDDDNDDDDDERVNLKDVDVHSLVLALIYEHSVGNKSPWYEFIASIEVEEQPLPLNMWKEEDKKLLYNSECDLLHMLDGGDVVRLLEECRKFAEGNKEFVDIPEVFERVEHKKQEQEKLELFGKFLQVVFSKSLYIDGFHGLALVPGADLFNRSKFEIDFVKEEEVCEICGEEECEHEEDDEEEEIVVDEDDEEGLEIESGEVGEDDEEMDVDEEGPEITEGDITFGDVSFGDDYSDSERAPEWELEETEGESGEDEDSDDTDGEDMVGNDGKEIDEDDEDEKNEVEEEVLVEITPEYITAMEEELEEEEHEEDEEEGEEEEGEEEEGEGEEDDEMEDDEADSPLVLSDDEDLSGERDDLFQQLVTAQCCDIIPLNYQYDKKFNNCGDMPNAHLLQRYGFVEEDNENDSCTLTVQMFSYLKKVEGPKKMLLDVKLQWYEEVGFEIVNELCQEDESGHDHKHGGECGDEGCEDEGCGDKECGDKECGDEGCGDKKCGDEGCGDDCGDEGCGEPSEPSISEPTSWELSPRVNFDGSPTPQTYALIKLILLPFNLFNAKFLNCASEKKLIRRIVERLLPNATSADQRRQESLDREHSETLKVFTSWCQDRLDRYKDDLTSSDYEALLNKKDLSEQKRMIYTMLKQEKEILSRGCSFSTE
ncbi:hypothetical protein CAAN1_07S07030 [[Candida] anglica]|uniref:SET domain-containing protein n=1 Tax=[Candida] anglica TaxID=148631 RepID=A0ABP0EBU5_9ASCO